jgi:hypothetical protein
VHRVTHPAERFDKRVVVDPGDVGGSPALAADEGAASDDQADAASRQIGGEVNEPLRGRTVSGRKPFLGGAAHEAVRDVE